MISYPESSATRCASTGGNLDPAREDDAMLMMIPLRREARSREHPERPGKHTSSCADAKMSARDGWPSECVLAVRRRREPSDHPTWTATLRDFRSRCGQLLPLESRQSDARVAKISARASRRRRGYAAGIEREDGEKHEWINLEEAWASASRRCAYPLRP